MLPKKITQVKGGTDDRVAHVQALGTSIHIDVSGNFNMYLSHTMHSMYRCIICTIRIGEQGKAYKTLMQGDLK